MKIINKIKRLIKRNLHTYYILYADMNELLEKAEKKLRPLPVGYELVKLTKDNMSLYKCKYHVDQMIQDENEALAVVDNDEIIAWHYGTYRGKTSLFFRIKNCDFEHVEILVDERYRRKGIALHLLYHMVKNINSENIKKNKVGTCIKPDNIQSIKLHESIGFKISRKVRLWHKTIIKDGRFVYLNFPQYKI